MKILKLFISLSLILSVSLINSLAAISVSDGSAFVTKAEFAADLNNLSNRMSSLENSLDAKIDSLVSSYLSRNGIWNGEKQTHSLTLNKGIVFNLNSSNFSQKVIANDNDGYCHTLIIGDKSVKVDGTSKGDIANEHNVLTTYSQKFCFPIAYHFMKANKSGLMSITLDFTTQDKNYNELAIVVNEWSSTKYNAGLTGIASLVLSSGDELNFNNQNSKWIASSSYGYSSYTLKSVDNYKLEWQYIPFIYGKISLLGFVNKDEYLNLGFSVSGFSAYYRTNKWYLYSEGGYIIKSISAEVY